MLARAGRYVEEFQRQLSGIVAEERYEQTVQFPQGRHFRSPQGQPRVEPTTRRLRSDLLLVKPLGAGDWFQFRDVFEVDGAPVRDRSERLMKLFVAPPPSIDKQITSIVAESSRFNIGNVLRTVNAPIVPLKFLEPKNQDRFRFKRTMDVSPAGMTRESPAPPGAFKVTTEVWAVQYAEHRPQTIVRTSGQRDLPARGRFWIEPVSGQVLMTELLLQDRFVRGAIDVNYQSEPLLGLLVPIEMRERYDRLADGSVIDGFATYSQFRQFQVKVTENYLLKK